jgi:hypothetical protein
MATEEEPDKSDTPNPEQGNPSHQGQEDGYSHGVDLVSMIAGEFGISQIVVMDNFREQEPEVRVNGALIKPDKRFRIPYNLAKDAEIEVVGRTLHFKMKFQG